MWKGIRYYNLGAIVLVAAAIVVGGMADNIPEATRETIADIFQDVVLLLSACAVWAARALADIRLILFGMLGLLLLFYVLTRPQADDH
jgi:4-amino-4-deoxy-L-arabinose transferase-like glycosyltransferase